MRANSCYLTIDLHDALIPGYAGLQLFHADAKLRRVLRHFHRGSPSSEARGNPGRVFSDFLGHLQ